MQMSAMKVYFQIAEYSLSYTKIIKIKFLYNFRAWRQGVSGGAKTPFKHMKRPDVTRKSVLNMIFG